MRKGDVFAVIVLTFVWVILSERLTFFVVATGAVISIGCLVISRRYLPFQKISNVNFLKLLTYPIHLLGQIYLSGFYVIKIIFTGARVEVVDVKTHLSNEFLKVILSNSVTLTPGSIMLELKDDTMTLLWLRGKNDPEHMENVNEILKGGLEKKLMRAQK